MGGSDFLLAPLVNAQHIADGALAVGYRIRAFLPGTDTMLTVYKDNGLSALTQPVPIGPFGFPEDAIFLPRGVSADFRLQTPGDITVHQWSNVGVGGAGSSAAALQFNQPIDMLTGSLDGSGFILGMIFVGDIRLIATPGRRVFVSGDSGAVPRYGTILSASKFINETTIDIYLDASLSSGEFSDMTLGTNQVYFSLLNPQSSAFPGMTYINTNMAPVGGVSFDSGAYSTIFPIGSMIRFVGGIPSPHNGFHICDGSALSRTAQNLLFSAIGTTFGAGDGSTTYTIPNVPSNPDDAWFIYAAQ